jgi:hypothetical protein
MKTRIGFTVLLSLVLTGACASEETAHNGYWWIGMPENFKLGFVTGYAKAMVVVFDVNSLVCMTEKGDEAIRSCVKYKIAPFDFTKIRFGQLSEGLDEFYKDFRNKGIDVDFGIRYVKDQLKNEKSAKELDEEVVRKTDLLRALQTEIQKHNPSTFMSDKHKIVQTGCSICQKHFGTVEQFKRHLSEDVLPPLNDRLSSEMNRG